MILLRRAVVLCACGLAASCSSSPPPAEGPGDAAPACTDADGDGYGLGADCLGPDCDDARADAHDLCRCLDDPRGPGCPCEGPEVEVCYRGPDGTASVGTCVAGLRTCEQGAWSGCDGETLPRPEECDYEDDDCDGLVDEGVTSVCGDCNGFCSMLCAGVGCDARFAAGDGTRVGDDGALEASPVRTPPGDLWVLVGQEGAVRVDAAARAVTGRYRLGSSAALPVAVAVDGAGNAYVRASSVDGSSPSVVVGIRVAACADLDEDGEIETSTGPEALAYGYDECVAWRTALESCDAGCSDATALALASDGATAWAALGSGDRVVELDTRTGARTGRSFTLEAPGAVLDDGAGSLWASEGGDVLVRLESDDPDPDSIVTDRLLVGPTLTAIDLATDGSLFTATPLSRVDAGEDSLTQSALVATSIAIDANGDLWSADDTSFVHRSPPELDRDDAFEVPGNATSLAVDRAGDVWVATHDPAALLVLDPGDGAVLADTLADCPSCLGDHPVLAGDPAGLRLERAFGPVWARGEGTALLVAPCDLSALTVEVERRGGSVRVFLRSAQNAGDLIEQHWIDLGTVPPDGPLQVNESRGSFHQIRLQTLDPDTVVTRVTLTGGC